MTAKYRNLIVICQTWIRVHRSLKQKDDWSIY